MEDLVENVIDRNEAVRNLFRKGYNGFNGLCKIYLESSDSDIDKKKVASKMKAIVIDLKTETKLSALKETINTVFDNIITDFEADLLHMSDKDQRLFMFSILGFSSSSIALFLDEESVRNVYNRRRHLKDRIKGLPPEKQSRYLAYLE